MRLSEALTVCLTEPSVAFWNEVSGICVTEADGLRPRGSCDAGGRAELLPRGERCCDALLSFLILISSRNSHPSPWIAQAWRPEKPEKTLELLRLSALTDLTPARGVGTGEASGTLGRVSCLARKEFKALKEAGPAPGSLNAPFLFKLVFSP